MTEIIGRKFGRYKILEPLGEGGMAAVYKGYDERLHREVAVKIIKVSQVGENRFLARFEREAEALAQLSHPNIVDIYDFGEERGLPYLVMEHLSGGTLKQRLGNPMRLQDAAIVVLPIAKALAYAHSQGIIHRDVKPSNILVRQNGEPVLTDFGIASRLESQHTLTGTGLGIGTPEYMSPEQGLGKKLDGRTDLYSLGVVLYELVTGKKPFEGATPGEIAIKQNTETAMRPSKILTDLDDVTDRVVLKALERDPDHRYTDMGAFVDVLEELIQGQPEEHFANIQLQRVVQGINSEDEQTIDALRAEVDALRSGKQGKKRGKAGLIVAGVVIVGLVVFGVLQFRPAAAPMPVVTETALATETEFSIITPTLFPTATATFTPVPSPTLTPTPTLGVGSTKISEIDGMEMVYVPAGNFIMGSESDGDPDEKPAHEVYLDNYWIDKYEISNSQYAKCVENGICEAKKYEAFSDSNFVDYPVRVNWYEAKNYCEWAGRILPNEAYWEKAARGDDGRIYPWGNNDPNSSLANATRNEQGSIAVGSYPVGASPYGAMDMAGNLWEWTSSLYKAYPFNAEDGREDEGESGSRVLRGGSYYNNKWYLRSSYRYWVNPYYFNNTGFRCMYID